MKYQDENRSKTVGRSAGDERAKLEANKIPAAEQLIYASRISGKGLLSTALEYRRLSRGRGKLTLNEYVDYGVALAADAEKERFISARRHWPIVWRVCELANQGFTEDKWMATHLMQEAGIATIPILAVIDSTERNFLSTPKISTSQEFSAFLSNADFPIFGKTNLGLGSFGAFSISRWDGELLTLSTGESFTPKEFLENWISGDTYVIQSKRSNHSALAKLSDHLITVRLAILNDEDRISIPAACLKVPMGANIADNFWRPGNLIAALDPQTGFVQRVRYRENGRVVDCPPEEAGSLIPGSFQIPQWLDLCELATECAHLFHSAKYASVDIAITPEGPLIVEANTGGGWELFQFASGKGFLTDEVISFFRKFGVDL